MADEETQNDKEEVSSDLKTQLTAKQKKNKKKKDAAKKKKQEQRERIEVSSNSEIKPKIQSEVKSEVVDSQENKSLQEKFEDELTWCIQQLEIGLHKQKTDKTTAQHTEKIMKNLKSPKTPMPKKRQIMFSVFGDYRKKMQEDLSKSIESKNQSKVCQVKKDEQKSIFLRVSQRQDKKKSNENSTQDKESLESPVSWKFEPSAENFKFDFANQQT